LNESNARPKRTAKELLAEIKSLYYAKRFDEARVLCKKLVKRFPNNQDLLGLYRKIEARSKRSTPQAGPEAAAASSGAGTSFESTKYYTEKAEALIDHGEGASGGDADVESLIKQGVTLYEVQDFSQALQLWNRALQIDPSNKVVQDYIANVRSMMAEEGQPSGREAPDKDKLLTIYNEGLKLYKDRHFDRAMEKWEYILEFFPGHKETQECLRKTKAAMEKEKEYAEELKEIEAEFKAGGHLEAERKILHLLIKAPHLEAAQRLKDAIEERKRQITEIRSLEIENSPTQHVSSATDDEITRFFTPDAAEGKKTEARQVVSPKRVKKPLSKWVSIGVPVIILLLAAGGYAFWRFQETKLRIGQGDEPIQVLITHEEAWDSVEHRVEDYIVLANDYADEGNNLIAYFAYLKADNLAGPRLVELKQELGSKSDKVIQDKLQRMETAKANAERELALAPNKIVEREVSEKEVDRAYKAIESQQYEDAIEPLSAALIKALNDEFIREKLAYAYEQIAFEKLASHDLDEAFTNFRRAAVLSPSDDELMRHLQVIKDFFDGKIDEVEKDQWFFFYSG